MPVVRRVLACYCIALHLKNIKASGVVICDLVFDALLPAIVTCEGYYRQGYFWTSASATSLICAFDEEAVYVYVVSANFSNMSALTFEVVRSVPLFLYTSLALSRDISN